MTTTRLCSKVKDDPYKNCPDYMSGVHFCGHVNGHAGQHECGGGDCRYAWTA